MSRHNFFPPPIHGYRDLDSIRESQAHNLELLCRYWTLYAMADEAGAVESADHFNGAVLELIANRDDLEAEEMDAIQASWDAQADNRFWEAERIASC